MVIDFRARGISRGARKLVWTPVLIIIKKLVNGLVFCRGLDFFLNIKINVKSTKIFLIVSKADEAG